MTSYALTLIGNIETAPLEPAHIDQVCQHLEVSPERDWLAENEACDLLFDSRLTSTALSELAHQALSGTRIDAVCTAVAGRRKKILISDMDSTIINQECIDELGDAMGIGPQIKEITVAVINGDISFSDALRQRMVLMEGMERGLLESVYENHISLMPGAKTFVRTMRHHGAYCILVSGGFSFFTQRIAKRVNFHDHQANTLIFAEDRLTGEVQEPILGRTAKLETLMRLCEEKGLQPSDTLAVGDGANDIKMIHAAGLGVAFHGSHSLKLQANAWIDYGDLTALLYIQGFRKSDFVGQ